LRNPSDVKSVPGFDEAMGAHSVTFGALNGREIADSFYLSLWSILHLPTFLSVCLRIGFFGRRLQMLSSICALYFCLGTLGR